MSVAAAEIDSAQPRQPPPARRAARLPARATSRSACRSDLAGIDGEIAEAFNDVVELNDRMTKEFERLGDVVGKQGKISHRAKLPGATGSWAASVDAVNTLIADMVHPTAEMARVIGAVAKGDLSPDHEPRERGAARCAASSCASARW